MPAIIPLQLDNNFQHITNVDIELLLKQLKANPQLWNENPERKNADGSPHVQMSDIWIRFRDKAELVEPKNYHEPHLPVWYPASLILNEVKRIALDVMTLFRAVQLGGILITKIPAGGEIKPHHDRGGWHAEYYNTKIYIPLESNPSCINTCEDDSVNMRAGEMWTFDNLKTHSVTNDGDTDRVTLIITLRVE